jgi:glycosyltransferase involved in cell wall biosynthesis
MDRPTVRILNVTQGYYPFLDEGGRPWKVRALSRELIAVGHSVSVVTADLGLARGFAKLDVTWAPNEGRTPWGWQRQQDGVDTHYLSSFGRYRTVTFNPHAFGFARALVRNYDVVHVFGIYDLLGLVMARACHRHGVPYVVEPMGMIQPIVRSLWKKRVYHALAGASLLRGAARVIATSAQEREEITESGVPKGICVLRRNGIDLREYETLPPRGSFRAEIGISADDFLLLFLGRISRVKGIPLLLKAMVGLPARTRLAIVGPDDRDGSTSEIRDLVERLGLRERVTLGTARYGVAKLQALADADLLVLPSEHENFGNVVVEAAACGLPAVVTESCGVAPLVGARAGVVVRRDEMSLREGIRGLLTAPDRLRELAVGAGALARELSWAEPVREMVQIYGEIISRDSSAVFMCSRTTRD